MPNESADVYMCVCVCVLVFVQGYFRRGTAHLALGKLKQAKQDFTKAVKIEPSNADARKKLDEVTKALRQERFSEAIGVESSAPVSVDPETMEVEASYDGPHLVDGKVTEKFMEDLVEHFKSEKKLHRKYAFMILQQVRDILKAERSLVEVKVPEGEHITVCGDVHGQFYDLCNIFKINGCPSPSNPYLFNGDFVDRGSFGIETIFTLFGYKALYPDHMHLNRGNHETVNMNKMYGFDGEVVHKYNRELMDLFTDAFRWLPLSHTLNSKVLVLHGGLFSKDETNLEDLKKIDRHCEPPDESCPMTELLWSDPINVPGRQPSKRGVGVAFGPDVATRFLEANGLERLVRSHECKDEGYEIDHDGKTITVFSAPNYCDQMGNKGAFIRFEADMVPKYTQFEAVAHPNSRPMQYAGLGGGFNFMQFLGGN
jgi:serine/threonine-protein phosphatase 5